MATIEIKNLPRPKATNLAKPTKRKSITSRLQEPVKIQSKMKNEKLENVVLEKPMKKEAKKKREPLQPINENNNVDKQLAEEEDRGEPKLFVEVNVGDQGQEKITVYEGDTAEALA
jgi:hypothetical protein